MYGAHVVHDAGARLQTVAAMAERAMSRGVIVCQIEHGNRETMSHKRALPTSQVRLAWTPAVTANRADRGLCSPPRISGANS